MQGQEIYKNILHHLEQLSPESLQEVHMFVNYLQMRENGLLTQNEMNHDLKLLSKNEGFHLEDEFEGYKERYPYEG